MRPPVSSVTRSMSWLPYDGSPARKCRTSSGSRPARRNSPTSGSCEPAPRAPAARRAVSSGAASATARSVWRRGIPVRTVPAGAIRLVRQPDGSAARGAGPLGSRVMADPALLTLAAERVTGVLDGAGGPDAILARRMQALSLAVHIPIVCFGIAFPAMMLFVEGLYLRTGDATYKALAKRWSKVAITIFAVGVVTGTILSFEFGLLWPNFMATFGEVFGVGFALEGVSFFIEAIFIAIYVYGWDRLPERTHFWTGVPVIISGFTGSFWVMGVNAWMNDPVGFDVAGGKVTDPKPWQALLAPNLGHELTHMYLAGYIVAGFIVAGVYAAAWLRGRRDLYHRAGLVVALSFAGFASGAQGLVGDWAGRRVADSQPVKLAAFEGLPRTENGAPFTIGGVY